MGFSFKSIGDIAGAISSTKDLVSGASDIMSTLKGSSSKKEKESKEKNMQDVQMYPEKIEKLIGIIISDGCMDEDEIEMLSRAAEKEGLDPLEVVLVAKKRLKGRKKMETPSRTAAQQLAFNLSEIDKKFDDAIEAIAMGDNNTAMSLLDTLTGGVSGLAVSIGKSIFGKSDDEKIDELEDARYQQRSRVISSTTLPGDLPQVLELLEYVAQQTKQNDENAWATLHVTVYNRAIMMAEGDQSKIQYITTLMPASLKPKMKKKFGLF